MKTEAFVLRYKNGMYVRRDDSTGPMSSGGYPEEVYDVDEATQWDTIEEAAQYGEVFQWRDFVRMVFRITITVTDLEAIPIPAKWSECNHHCHQTTESTAPSAKHYLDCPVWQVRLAAIKR